MTDNPSSSEPVSKEREIEAEIMSKVFSGWSTRSLFGIEPWTDEGPRRTEERHPHGPAGRSIFCRACMLTHPTVLSALASQEARHRQEMEEAKRERADAVAQLEVLRKCIYQSFRDLIPAIPVGLDPAGYRVGMAERLWKQAERSREALLYTSDKQTVAWKQRAEAAEQREREAGAVRATLVVALIAQADEVMWDKSHCFCGPNHGPRAHVAKCLLARAALAAIRCAPSPVHVYANGARLEPCPACAQSPVSAPPRKPVQGMVQRVGCDRPDGTMNIHMDYETCEVCASPVEPGSDPQEPETR